MLNKPDLAEDVMLRDIEARIRSVQGVCAPDVIHVPSIVAVVNAFGHANPEICQVAHPQFAICLVNHTMFFHKELCVGR